MNLTFEEKVNIINLVKSGNIINSQIAAQILKANNCTYWELIKDLDIDIFEEEYGIQCYIPTNSNVSFIKLTESYGDFEVIINDITIVKHFSVYINNRCAYMTINDGVLTLTFDYDDIWENLKYIVGSFIFL